MALQQGVTTDTPDNVILGPGKLYEFSGSFDPASPGTLLGATMGGNEYSLNAEIYETDYDGRMGPVKGGKRISMIEPTLTTNLLEHTSANWLRALPGGESTELTPTWTLDDLGEGDGSATDFTLTSADAEGEVFLDTLEVYKDGTLQTEGGGEDYTYDDTTQTITFNSPPSDSVTINAIYTYDSSDTSGDYKKVTVGQITDSDYANVALKAEINNASYDKPFWFVLNNTLASGDFNMALSGESEEETVLTVDFVAHFDPADGLDLDSTDIFTLYRPTT